MDPQLRKLLEVTHEAWVDSGVDVKQLRGSDKVWEQLPAWDLACSLVHACLHPFRPWTGDTNRHAPYRQTGQGHKLFMWLLLRCRNPMKLNVVPRWACTWGAAGRRCTRCGWATSTTSRATSRRAAPCPCSPTACRSPTTSRAPPRPWTRVRRPPMEKAVEGALEHPSITATWDIMLTAQSCVPRMNICI